MRILILIIISFVATSVYCQQADEGFDGHSWLAPYYLPAPENWGIERFLIPISFAPQIHYKGVEDIRFTPGWAKVKSEQYWSYAFLWYLDGDIKLNSRKIEKNLKAYYTGLTEANGKNIPKEKMIRVKTIFEVQKPDKNDLKTFVGAIKMLDYMSQSPMVLMCKVHVRKCEGENKTFIFYELSPQALTHPVWNRLDEIWEGFKCKR